MMGFALAFAIDVACKSNQIFIAVFMARDIDVQKCPMEKSEKKDQERKCLRSTESINIEQ